MSFSDSSCWKLFSPYLKCSSRAFTQLEILSSSSLESQRRSYAYLSFSFLLIVEVLHDSHIELAKDFLGRFPNVTAFLSLKVLVKENQIVHSWIAGSMGSSDSEHFLKMSRLIDRFFEVVPSSMLKLLSWLLYELSWTARAQKKGGTSRGVF